MHLICTLSLVVVVVWLGFDISIVADSNEVTYQSICESLECLIDARTIEMFERDRWLYVEMARTEAMDSIGREVVTMMYQ